MPAVTVQDLNIAKQNVDHIAAFATSSDLVIQDRLGNYKTTLAGWEQYTEDAVNALIQGIGYLPPVAYTSGINLTSSNQVVEYNTNLYAPIISFLPFTTSGTFETNKFRVIQGYSGFVTAQQYGKSGGNTIANLVGIIPTQDKLQYDCYSYYNGSLATASGPTGGGTFVYNAALPKSQHNGGTIISPTVPWDGTQAALANFLNGVGETAPSGNGCWVRKDDVRISVSAFGLLPGITADQSASFNKALDLGKRVFAPAGTYYINSLVTKKFILEGDGSTATILKPYSLGTAALTYRNTGDYWSYHSEVRDIGFASTGMAGIGFTFARSNPADYQTYDEYSNNVKFYGVRWTGLNKGIAAFFGNIGSEFYSCGWSGNKYGCYFLDSKFGGLMHAGNKYFFGGQFDGNDVGVYTHNATDGFGGLEFNGTIFEYNKINTYTYTTSSYLPTQYSGQWSEGSGPVIGGNVTIDSWSGTTLSTQTIPARSFIVDGSNSDTLVEGGVFVDWRVMGTNNRVSSNGSRVETRPGFGGELFTVDNDSSEIVITDPSSIGGIFPCDRVICKGNIQYRLTNIDADSSNASARGIKLAARATKITGSGGSGVSLPLNTQVNLGEGSFNVTGTVTADGVLYPNCNEYSIPFTTTSQYCKLLGSTITLGTGYYVCTFDVKVTGGAPVFLFWDRNTSQFFNSLFSPAFGKWHTLAAIGYSNAAQTIYFDIGCSSAATATFRLSAFQIRKFDSAQEARQFLASLTYIES